MATAIFYLLPLPKLLPKPPMVVTSEAVAAEVAVALIIVNRTSRFFPYGESRLYWHIYRSGSDKQFGSYLRCGHLLCNRCRWLCGGCVNNRTKDLPKYTTAHCHTMICLSTYLHRCVHKRASTFLAMKIPIPKGRLRPYNKRPIWFW